MHPIETNLHEAGLRLEYADGALAIIERDGRWRLTLPDGGSKRGKAEDMAAARAAVEQARRDWFPQAWANGRSAPGGWFVPFRG